ncbi:MAG TPA: hypothetical protein VH914_13185 [Acidimicrobiia bacterium]|nr:hypothetical protein [Acidimicrobiia bacterium]
MKPYEFDEKQDEVVATLANSMINVAMITLLGSIAMVGRSVLLWLAIGIAGNFGLAQLGLTASVGEIAVAALLLIAGRKLVQIPRTEGEDMPNLMSALSTLATTYLIQGVAFAAVTGLVLWAAFAW